MGPDDIHLPLNNTSDVGMYESSTRAEVTSGQLYWADGQAGAQPINVVIKPYSPGIWHVEKRYFIRICGIRSSSSAVDAGQISPTSGTVTVIVCIAMFLLCL